MHYRRTGPGSTGAGVRTREQNWTLDDLGNWAGRAQDKESEDAFEKLRRDGYM